MSRASVRTQWSERALFLVLYVQGVVAVSVDETRRVVHGPTTAAMRRPVGRAARPAHTSPAGPASTKMLTLARTTPSPAGHDANRLAFHEGETHQPVGSHAECAQQGSSLAGAEFDAAGNQGGVDRAPSLAAIACLEDLDFAPWSPRHC